MTRSATSKKTADPQRDYVSELFLHDEQEDRRGLRLSIALAVLLHGVLLFMTIPSLQTTQAEPAVKPKTIRLAPPPKWRKPVETEPIPQRREKLREIPMPDDTPDEDPWVPLSEQLEVDLELDDGPFLDLPSAPPPPPAEPEGPVRVGGKVAPPERIFYIQPRYTEMARRARIQGIVSLQATIDTDGNVVDLEVIKGQPLGLTEAAVEAVSKWRFEPSRLNGKEVAVLYVVNVNFTLN